MTDSSFSQLITRIRNWLRASPYVHIREKNLRTIGDVINLIDRFMDGKVKYDLEWDDFISWKQESPAVEEVRERLGCSESFLFSKSMSDRKRYISALLEERNRLAAFTGIPLRSSDSVAFISGDDSEG